MGLFGGSSSSGVAVEDEGVAVTDANTIDFTGAGVDATDDGGGHVTVDIPGGSASDQAFVWDPVADDYIEGGRIFIGPEDPDVQYTPQAGDAWLDLESLMVGVSDLVGLTVYEPGSADNKSTAGTSSTNGGTDVDATNLAVTFTTPQSGRVLVDLSALTAMNADNNNEFWTLREGSVQVGFTQRVTDDSRQHRLGASFLITGLVPGSVHTYKWGWFVSGSTANIYIQGDVGSVLGAAIMVVRDAAIGTNPLWSIFGPTQITEESANYTALLGDVVLADATGGAFNVDLPAPSYGAWVTVKKVDASANAVTVTTPGAETIDGAATYPISTQWISRDFLCDGTDWFIL